MPPLIITYYTVNSSYTHNTDIHFNLSIQVPYMFILTYIYKLVNSFCENNVNDSKIFYI